MYRPVYFQENNRAVLVAFIKNNSFAILTGLTDQFPVATQIPVEIEEKDGQLFLIGHLMKHTDHHTAFEKNDKVLVLFNGPHCFVSAAWYQNPASASTWNYMTVQAKGKIFFTDEKETRAIIQQITEKYEGFDSPASFDRMEDDYINKMLKAIVGFRIAIESIEGVFKLSQNKTKAEQLNIIQELKKSQDQQAQLIALAMESNTNHPTT